MKNKVSYSIISYIFEFLHLRQEQRARVEFWSWEGLSADGDQLVVGNIVPDGMFEGNGLTAIDDWDIDTPASELVNESLVVIGTHTCPAMITNLAVEDVY